MAKKNKNKSPVSQHKSTSPQTLEQMLLETPQETLEQMLQQVPKQTLQMLQKKLQQTLQPDPNAYSEFMTKFWTAIEACRVIWVSVRQIICSLYSIGDFCATLFFWITLVGFVLGPQLSKVPWLFSSLSKVHQLQSFFPSTSKVPLLQSFFPSKVPLPPPPPLIDDAYDKRLYNLRFFRLRTVKLKLGLVFKHLLFDQTWHELMISLALALKKIGHEIQVLTLEDGPMHVMWSDYGFDVHIIGRNGTINVDWLSYSAVLLNSIEAVDIMCWLNQDRFKRVLVIWTVRDGQLGSLLNKKYSIGQMNSWREVFSRANAVVFPNYNLIAAYTVVNFGNQFVIPNLPTDLGEPASDIMISKSIEAYALLLEAIIAIPPGSPADSQDVPEFIPEGALETY